MLKLRLSGALALLATLVTAGAAGLDWSVDLDGHRVHPTRILARYQKGDAGATPQRASLVSSLGLVVRGEVSLVPGLVVLDEPESTVAPLGTAVIDREAQARRLADRIGALRRSGLYLYAEPDYVQQALLEPDDDAAFQAGWLWGLKNGGGNGGTVGADISATEAWDITTGDTNVVVAVIDTGIRYTHYDLAAQMWRNPGEIGLDDDGNDKASNGIDDDGNNVIDDVFGINAFDPDNITGDPYDLDDHGTHVAGTIGAAANDGNPHVGVAWQVQLMACKFLGAFGGTTLGAIECIRYATENGARIMNNSWGGGAFSTALLDTITAAEEAGILFVAAAGNDGTDNDVEPHYPSNYEVNNVISVAATDRADRLAQWPGGGGSNYGATTVDLGAPGLDIWSSISISDEAYEYFSGTSMAAPHVTGVAALVVARYPAISLFELRQRLLETVINIPSLDGITVTGGRVNAFKALTATGDGELELFVNPASEAVILSGTTQQVYVVVSDLFGVNDAVVTGTWVSGATGTLTFKNDGNNPDDVAQDFTYSAEFNVPGNVSEMVIDLVAQAPWKVGVTNRVRWYVAEPPTNDDFADAIKLPSAGRVVYSNNKFATMQLPEEPLHAGVPTVNASLWWSYSSPIDVDVLVDTAGSDFDTVVGIYTNKPLAAVREVASANNPDGRKQAYVSFTALAGHTYYLAVASAITGERGSIRLRVEPNGIPDVLPPILAFEAPANGTVVSTNYVRVSGMAIDPSPGSGVAKVAVKLQTSANVKLANGTDQWGVNIGLNPGYNVIEAVGFDYANNQSQPIRLSVQYLPPTVDNDFFVNALELDPEAGGVVAADNQTATREFQEPYHGGNQGGHSVWYRWTAPDDGTLTLQTTNATFDTLLGLYTGVQVGDLTTVAGNDDGPSGNTDSFISIGVRSGTVYHIAVDGYGGGSGEAELAYAFTAGPLVHLSVTAGPNGRVNQVSGDYATGTTVTLSAYPDSGYAFRQWQRMDGSVVSGENPLNLTLTQDESLTAVFASPAYTDGFEGGFSPDLHYQDAGRPWTVEQGDSASGQWAARSGVIGNNGRSTLILATNMTAGVVSFAYRVSSEKNFDVLEFRVNGMVEERWSGESDWATYQTVVLAGTNTLEWTYSKDGSVSEGQDVALIDDLTIPLGTVEPEPSSEFSVEMVADAGQQVVSLRGEPGRRYVIEASADLVAWQEMQKVMAQPDGTVLVRDRESAGVGSRFYRARAL